MVWFGVRGDIEKEVANCKKNHQTSITEDVLVWFIVGNSDVTQSNSAKICPTILKH